MAWLAPFCRKSFGDGYMAPPHKPRVYLDANIFIAFVKGDMGKPFKLMYQDVDDFLGVCPGRFVVVLSGLAFLEIGRKAYWSKQELLHFFLARKIDVEVIEGNERRVALADEFRRKGVHSADAFHAALAVDSDCDVLLTYNKKDFRPVEGLIQVLTPKELLEG